MHVYKINKLGKILKIYCFIIKKQRKEHQKVYNFYFFIFLIIFIFDYWLYH
jgi:hypothetical protein